MLHHKSWGSHQSSQKRNARHANTTLRITNKLSVTPLLDICNDDFAVRYSNGLWWSLYGDYKGNKPIPDSYLVDNLKRDVAHGYFDGQHDDWLPYIGFYFGAVHGCVLSPDIGQLCSDVTTLVTFQSKDGARGYNVGRRDRIYNTPPDIHICTDAELIEELRQTALDLLQFPDEQGECWFYTVGCILGNLSVQLFPATSQERQQWEAEFRMWREKCDRDMAKARETEPSPTIEHTI